jgi:uncharacterized membrane protein (DUF485 family)
MAEPDIDIKKLKENDRRLLLNFWTEQTKWNANNMLYIFSIYFSFIVLLTGLFSLTYSIEKGFTLLVNIVGILYVLIFIIAMVSVKRANKTFKKLAFNADKHYKELFDLHFKYARLKK